MVVVIGKLIGRKKVRRWKWEKGLKNGNLWTEVQEKKENESKVTCFGQIFD